MDFWIAAEGVGDDDEKKISDARELRLLIGSMAPGSKAQIEVNRESQTKTFEVELAEMPAGTTEEGPETSPEEP